MPFIDEKGIRDDGKPHLTVRGRGQFTDVSLDNVPSVASALSGTIDYVPTAGTLTLPLVITTDATYTPVGDGTTPFVLPLASTGHAGSYHTVSIFLDANDWTALRIAPDANVAGDGIIDANGNVTDFDPTKAYTIHVTYANGYFSGVLRMHDARDVTAPTISSAIIYAAELNVLWLQLTEACWASDITGLSISDTGANRTLSSLIASTNGTSLLKFNLSGAVGLSDTVTFTVGSTRSLQDLNGTKLGTGTTSVSIAGRPYQSMANCVLDCWTASSTELTLSGTDVDAWLDRSTSATNGNGTLSAAKPTWIADTGDGTGAIAITCTTTNTGIQALLFSDAINEQADFSVFILVKGLSAAFASYFMSFGGSATNPWIRHSHDSATSGGIAGFDVDGSFPDATGADQIAMATGTWELMKFSRIGSNWEWKNIRTGATHTEAVSGSHPAACNRFCFGAWYTIGTFWNGSKIQIKALAAFSTYQNSTAEGVLRGLWQDAFTDCP